MSLIYSGVGEIAETKKNAATANKETCSPVPVAFKIQTVVRALAEHGATTVPDYSEARVERLAEGVTVLRTELVAMDGIQLPLQDIVDLRLLEVEINALEFCIHVL